MHPHMHIIIINIVIIFHDILILIFIITVPVLFHSSEIGFPEMLLFFHLCVSLFIGVLVPKVAQKLNKFFTANSFL